MTIRKATTDDILAIREWLEETQSGFLNNWNLIEKGQTKGEVTVLLDGAVPIAYCLSSQSTLEIFEVKKSRRLGGTGRQLVHHILAEERDSGSWAITGFCQPEESLPFWLKVGFQRAVDPNQEYQVAYPFRHKHEIPKYMVTCQLDFKLHSYPDDAPYASKSITAAIEYDGTYSLTEDFLEYAASIDMRLTVTRDGELLYDDKCKYIDEVGGELRFPWVRVRYLEPVVDT